MKKYLQLPTDFFRSDEMMIIENRIDGWMYSSILLKLYLVSMNNSGLLTSIDNTPFSMDEIAALVGFSTNDVEDAINLFKRLGLAKVWENQGIFFPYANSNMIVTE